MSDGSHESCNWSCAVNRPTLPEAMHTDSDTVLNSIMLYHHRRRRRPHHHHKCTNVVRQVREEQESKGNTDADATQLSI